MPSSSSHLLHSPLVKCKEAQNSIQTSSCSFKTTQSIHLQLAARGSGSSAAVAQLCWSRPYRDLLDLPSVGDDLLHDLHGLPSAALCLLALPLGLGLHDLDLLTFSNLHGHRGALQARRRGERTKQKLSAGGSSQEVQRLYQASCFREPLLLGSALVTELTSWKRALRSKSPTYHPAPSN